MWQEKEIKNSATVRQVSQPVLIYERLTMWLRRVSGEYTEGRLQSKVSYPTWRA